jgi:hypothetical protein
MRGSWPVVGLVALLVVGCIPPAAARTTTPLAPQTELERAVVTAGLEAWRSVGFATTPAVGDVQRFRIAFPATVEAYEQACPPAIVGPSGACLGWRDQGAYPIAYISPALPRARVPHAALHEWIHAAGYRFGRWPDYDSPAHSDEKVWAGKAGSRPDSVEQRAQRMLDR